MHDSSPSKGEVEAGGSDAQGHPQLHRDSEASLGYIEPCPKINGREEGTGTEGRKGDKVKRMNTRDL